MVRLPWQRRPRVLVAAASRIRLDDNRSGRRTGPSKPQEWQRRAWDAFDVLPEVKYPYRFYGNAVRKVRFFPAWQAEADDDPVPLADASDLPAGVADVAVEAWEALRPDDGSEQAVLHSEGAVNRGVAGEFYLVGRRREGRTGDAPADYGWQVCSTDELRREGDRIKVYRAERGGRGEELEPDDWVIRMWNPHPRFSHLPDSNVRGVLDACDELRLLRLGNKAIAQSRIANAGLLWISDQLELMGRQPNPVLGAGAGEGQEAGSFADLLADVASQAIDNPGDASAVVPLVLRGGSADPEKLLRHFTFDRPLDEAALKRQTELVRTIGVGIDLPMEILTGVADVNHWRSDAETEIFTERGWLRYDQVEPGVQCLTLRHNRGVAAWEPLAGVVVHEVDEDALRIEGRYHSSLTSLDHRWPVVTSRPGGRRGARRSSREWIVSEDFEANTATGRGVDHAMVLAVPVADVPTDPKWSDDLVRLVAYLATGADLKPTPTGNPVFRVRQRKPEIVEEIDGVLRRAGFGFARGHDRFVDVEWFRLHVDASAAIIDLGQVLGTRWAPGLAWLRDLTRPQLLLFLDAAERMNGGTADARTVFAVDRRRLDCVEAAALLAGFRCTTRQRGQQTGFGDQPVWRCTWGTTETFTPRPHHIERVRYRGVMWCPRLPIGASFLARRRGHTFWTGNTAWQIESSTFHSHIEPGVLQQASDYAGGYLRPLVADALGLDPNGPELARLVVWYDPVDLIASPDRAAAADSGHDRWAISDASWRNARGFGDADAPDDDEIQRRLALRRGSLTAGLLVEIAKLSGLLPEDFEMPAEDPESVEPPADPQDQGSDDDGDDGRGPPEDGPPGDGAAARDERDTTMLLLGATLGRAAAGRGGNSTSRFDELGERLVEIDRDLRHRLLVAADAAMAEALRRAGARLRSAAQGNETTRSAVRGVEPSRVGITLGRGVARALNVDDDELLDETFDELVERYGRWTQRSQQAARRETELALGRELTADELAELEPAQAEDRDRGAALLLAGMLGLARQRLWGGEPEVPAVGEVDDLSVPAGLVRRVLAVAGGDDVTEGPAGGVGRLPDGRAPGGAVTGGTLEDVLVRAARAERAGWRWVYGDPGLRERSFEPHLDLDGVVIDSFDDDALTNSTDAWLDSTGYYPGDHSGCLCDVVPLWRADEPDA